MTGQISKIGQLVKIWDGVAVPPSRLTTLINEHTTRSTDFVENLALAARVDYADLPHVLAGKSALTTEQLLHLSRRLGWTIRTLADWDPRIDSSGVRIEASLVSAAAWNTDGDFWQAVESCFKEKSTTIAGLDIVLRSRDVRAHVPNNAPIWEREHLLDLQKAEGLQDWAEVGERAHAFKRLSSFDIGARQAVLALSQLKWQTLIRLADRVESWFYGHLILEPLTLATAVRLATLSKSGHVRFAALDRVANREVRPLQPEEEVALRNLLIISAQSEVDWPAWLTIFNRYPVRHPHIQTALARALSRCKEHALLSYVDSISLTTSDVGIRDCVTRCLSIFRFASGKARRLTLWHAAFRRWQKWDFAASEDRPLSELTRSALDYGLVGWLVEGTQRSSLAEVETSFEEELRAHELRWHASVSWAISGFLRLISRHQIFAHAASRTLEDPDWLSGPTVYCPRVTISEFVRRKYNWNPSDNEKYDDI